MKNVFLFHYKITFRALDIQILEFKDLRIHDIIKCLSMKQEKCFTE